ncbi:MAG: hypothetical protein AAGG69_12225 [Pseudomonadota bacterium]
MQIFRFLASWCGATLIILCMSELVFFNEDAVVDMINIEGVPYPTLVALEMFAIYLALMLVFLAALRLSGAGNVAAIVLCGAIAGWAIEGVIIPVVYEAPPFSYAWTAISWHMVFDVMIGWLGLIWLMQRERLVTVALATVLAGALWGYWSTWIWGDGLRLEPSQFIVYSGAITFVLIAGAMMSVFGRASLMKLPKWICWLSCVVALGFGVLTGLPYGIFAVGLAAIVAFNCFALWRLSTNRPDAGFLVTYLKTPVRWRNAIPILALWPAAVASYAALYAVDYQMPLEDITALFLVIGVLIWLWAIAKGLFHKRGNQAG